MHLKRKRHNRKDSNQRDTLQLNESSIQKPCTKKQIKLETLTSGFKYVLGLTQDKEKHTAEDPWRIGPSTNQQIQQSRENHLSLFTHLRDQLSLNT